VLTSGHVPHGGHAGNDEDGSSRQQSLRATSHGLGYLAHHRILLHCTLPSPGPAPSSQLLVVAVRGEEQDRRGRSTQDAGRRTYVGQAEHHEARWRTCHVSFRVALGVALGSAG
jgi:hypothetical protein